MRSTRGGIILIGIALTLAACSTSGGATPTPSPIPTATTAPTPETAATAPLEETNTYVIDPARTRVSYSVEETLLNENNRLNTAVGTTHSIEGQFTLNFADPTRSEFGTFSVDLSTLTSDSSMRDNRIRFGWLESARYPIATFVVRSVQDFPAAAQVGQVVPFKLLGDLTVKQTTRAVTWDVNAKLENDLLTGTATTFILMADFGIEPPNIAGILTVKDGVTLTVEFVMLPTK